MDKEPDYGRILDIIRNSEDCGKLTAFAQNAQKKGVQIVAKAARDQLKGLIPRSKAGSFEAQFWKMFSAYEDLLLDNQKPVTILNGTREEALSSGEISALANWINEGHQSWALNAFISMKKSQQTAEKLALKHQDLFNQSTRDYARARLEKAQGL